MFLIKYYSVIRNQITLSTSVILLATNNLTQNGWERKKSSGVVPTGIVSNPKIKASIITKKDIAIQVIVKFPIFHHLFFYKGKKRELSPLIYLTPFNPKVERIILWCGIVIYCYNNGTVCIA